MQKGPYGLLKKSISRFCRLDHRTWKLFENIFVFKTIAKKDIFAVEGEDPETFGFVCNGCLRMFNSFENGNEMTKHFLLSKDFFVGAVSAHEKNLVSIQALTDCQLLVTGFKKLDQLSEKETAVLEFKNNLVSDYIQIKQKRENDYLSMNAQSRYTLFIKAFPDLLNQIPHYYIASYLGISPTQLSRIRKKISIK